MATAIQGAILIKNEPDQMIYREKCERCGYVDSTERLGGRPPGRGIVETSSFNCPKCGNNQRIEIHG